MAQDVVRGRDEEEEVWQRELPQIVVAFHLAFGAAGHPRNDLVLTALDLRACQAVDESERVFTPLFRRREAGVVDRREVGSRDTGQTARRRAAEVRRLTKLPCQAEHVGIKP